MFARIRLWYRKRLYRPGRVVSCFLAPDVRRDVEVVDASRLDAGLLMVRTRTWNVLYAIKGLAPEPPFGELRTVALEDLWVWSGEPWGGPSVTRNPAPQPIRPDAAVPGKIDGGSGKRGRCAPALGRRIGLTRHRARARPSPSLIANFVPMKVSEVLRRLRAERWVRVKSTGSYRQFKHPDRPGRVTVSGKPSHTVPPGTLKSIFRQAGWDE